MKTNALGVDLIKQSEALRLDAYLCPAGIPTIGYGHTGDVELGQSITEHQADAILSVDLDKFERGVAELTEGVPLNENQFSALVSFAFNVGLSALKGSTLLKRLKRGRFDDAAEWFLPWNKAGPPGGKVVLSGLVARRKSERALFLLPPQPKE